jgi:hypothetical protein
MQTKFSDVLESVEALPLEEKEMLVEIIRKRMIEERREELRRSIAEAEAEYEEGHCSPMTVDEIMFEIRS